MAPRRDIPPADERMKAARERERLRELYTRNFRQHPILTELAKYFPRRGRKPGSEGGEAVPVDPNRPNHLSGGAAAELDFGE